MIKQNHNIDPVERDLFSFLLMEDQYDITTGRFRAIAENEFEKMDYVQIIECADNNYTDLGFLFEYIIAEKIEEAKRALNNFLQTVKNTYIDNRAKELEEDEENQRQSDAAFEKYFEKYYEEKTPDWC